MLALAGLRPALGAEDVVLGTRTVNLIYDHDHLHVGLVRGLFTRARLEVGGNGIFIQNLTVNFVNAEHAELAVRSFIPAGGRTRNIDLPGTARAIRSIDITYRHVPLGGRATVTFIGRKLS